MTFLSDVIKVLHAADVPSYSVHSATRELEDSPDLVIDVRAGNDPSADDSALAWASTMLRAAPLPIRAIRRAGPTTLHVWAEESRPDRHGKGVDLEVPVQREPGTAPPSFRARIRRRSGGTGRLRTSVSPLRRS